MRPNRLRPPAAARARAQPDEHRAVYLDSLAQSLCLGLPIAERLLTASGFAPSNDLESAILANLPPGAYTAVVCPFFATQPTAYRGKLTLTASSAAQA